MSTRPKNDDNSLSPKALKQRAEGAQKFMQKIDSNMSPNIILKQYKLGYSPIRFQNSFQRYEREPRNSVSTKI
jgi:hypothetical protein